MTLSMAAAALIPVLMSAGPPPAQQKQGVAVPAESISWRPLSSKQGVGGPVIHVLSGDPAKGASVFLLKLPGEGEIPPHTTSSQYKAVVISGTWMHTFGNDPASAISAGGYWVQPARQPQTDRCPAGPDCVVLIHSAGRFDIVPAKRAGMAGTRQAEPASR